jgi:hypothetical protein
MITSEYTPVGVVDDLFSLPSPVAIVSLLFKYPKLRLLPLITLAILIQALVLVGVFAPGSLLVGLYNHTYANRTIPRLDLTTLPNQTDTTWWMDIARHYMITDPFESWNMPAECGISCQFEITYQAPGISCRQTSEQETPLKPFDLQLYDSGQKWDFYSSNSTFDMTWGTNNSPLNFSFVPMITKFSSDDIVSVNQTGLIQGQLCEFHDKVYRVTFEYLGYVRRATVEVIANANNFTQTCSWNSSASLSPDCNQYARIATNMSLGFTRNFVGTAGWGTSGSDLNWQQYPLKKFLNYSSSSEYQTKSLIPAKDLSKLLENSFANVVLGILLRSGQTQSGAIAYETGGLWVCDGAMLLGIYVPVLLIVLVVGLCGLRWARQGDIVREKKFSSFLVTTRTKDLDIVCVQHSDLVMSTKLRHDAQTGRFIVQDDGKVDKSTPNLSQYLKFQ